MIFNFLPAILYTLSVKNKMLLFFIIRYSYKKAIKITDVIFLLNVSASIDSKQRKCLLVCIVVLYQVADGYFAEF